MAIAIFPKRWTNKPTGAVQINWGHQLASGLRSCWLFNDASSVADLALGRSANFVLGTTRIGHDGTALKPTTSGGVGEHVYQVNHTLDDLTNNASGAVVWRLYPAFGIDATTRYQWGHAAAGPALPEFDCQIFGDNNWYVGWNTGAGDHRVSVAASTSNLVQNEWQTYVLTWGPAGSFFYRNNLLLASNGTAPSTTNIGTNFEWGSATSFVNVRDIGAASMLGLGYIYSGRTLSPTEVAWLYEEPYAMIQPMTQRTYFTFGRDWTARPGTPRSASIIGVVRTGPIQSGGGFS